MEYVSEGSVKLLIPQAEKISRQMRVFYNPAMGLNRDVSILLINSINKEHLQMADPLAASGVRGIRFLKELKKNKIKNISINDGSQNACNLIKTNLLLNKINYKKNTAIKLKNEDANSFLLESAGFDYIDIDPFGTPNPFLDSAIKRLARDGILAVTATDTGALCGTFPRACIRKYWAAPKKGPIMHETGLRILIRKIQLVGAQYDKALLPIFSYSKEHYMRVFLRNEKSKNKADKILRQHGFFNGAGPMWLGNLWDKNLCNGIFKDAIKDKIFKKDKNLISFLETIREESKIDIVGFHDLNYIAGKNKIKNLLKKEIIKNKIKKSGYKASGTHFKGEGIRSDIQHSKLIKLLKTNKFL